MKIDDSSYKILENAMDITGYDYNIKWFDKDIFYGYIEVDDLLSMIEDLTYEVERLKEEKEDMQEYMNEHYRHISKSEEYEISDRDFI